MKIATHLPLLESILDVWRDVLADDYTAYLNHCYRVANFCLALSGESEESRHKVSIATAYHDLGIWTDKTLDYLEPSTGLATEHLQGIEKAAWRDEVVAMIEHHHALMGNAAAGLVDSFRKADWIDISLGALKCGLPSAYVREVKATFPNAGFHKRLMSLTWQRLKSHPFSPLPMLRIK